MVDWWVVVGSFVVLDYLAYLVVGVQVAYAGCAEYSVCGYGAAIWTGCGWMVD